MALRTSLFAAALCVACAGLLVPVLAQMAPSDPAVPAEPAKTAPSTEAITYKIGEAEFEGFLAQPAAADKEGAKLPAVLIVHDWMGDKQFEHDKAIALAKLGYVAFSCDMYGKGIRPKNPQEAAARSGAVRKDPAVLRDRVAAALKLLKERKGVDAAKVCAMGFCFGGGVVLELARSGADVAAVVSFHGGLATTLPASAETLKAKVLVLHGADDPFVPQEQVTDFMAEMKAAKADWHLVQFGNSVHAFTNPDAGTDNSKGGAYNEKANARSWEMLKDFLAEVTG